MVLPNGQYVAVRCDIKTKARDVFDMVVAHANLVEHFYFSLAFLDGEQPSFEAGPISARLFEVELRLVLFLHFLIYLADDEFFFLEHETKISKVAPDSWKKGQISSFFVFLRVKYFVDDISFIL